MINMKLVILFSILEVFLIVLGLEVHDYIRAYRVRRSVRKLFSDHMEEFFEEQDKRKKDAMEAKEKKER